MTRKCEVRHGRGARGQQRSVVSCRDRAAGAHGARLGDRTEAATPSRYPVDARKRVAELARSGARVAAGRDVRDEGGRGSLAGCGRSASTAARHRVEYRGGRSSLPLSDESVDWRPTAPGSPLRCTAPTGSWHSLPGVSRCPRINDSGDQQFWGAIAVRAVTDRGVAHL